MPEVARLQGVVDVEVEKAAQGLRETQRGFEETARAADRATGSFQGVSSGAGQLNDLLGQMGLGLSLAMFTKGMIDTTRAASELAMQSEANEIAFRTLIGTTEGATQHLQELRDFAATTPFQFTELVDASKRMQALGFEASQVVPMLTTIGDAAAALGTGQVGIDRMVLALGQMNAKGRVMGQELLQLTEAGIPALRYLADQANVTQAEMSKMVEKGMVPADQAIQAILAGAKQDFGGLMAEQANTAATAFSNLKDTIDRTLSSWGNDLNNTVKPGAQFLSEYLGTYNAVADAWKEGNITLIDANAIALQYILGLKTAKDVTEELTAAREADRRAVEGGITVGNEFFDSAQNIAPAFEGIIDGMNDAGAATDFYTEKLKALNSYVGSTLSDTLQNNADKNTELKTRQEELRAEIEKLTTSNGAYYETVKGNGLTTAELELATAKLAQAQARLSEETDPVKAAQLRVEIEKQQGAIAGANVTVSGYVDNSKKIGELQTEYDDVTDAIKENEAASDRATKRIIYNLLAQKLATDGVTNEEYNFLLRVAGGFGLIDQTAMDAGITMSTIAEEAANTGDWTTAASKVFEYTNALNGIPTTVTTDVVTRYSQQGTPSSYQQTAYGSEDFGGAGDDGSGGGGGGGGGGGSSGGGGNSGGSGGGGNAEIAQSINGAQNTSGATYNFNVFGIDDPYKFTEVVIGIMQDRGLVDRVLMS